ncbi:hypothetical protein GNF76_27265 [Pseudomonas sp. CCM 7893]|uniref:Uncharacterized protein n=1 Tax=Pseudomonas spelaei TaxID=1055469 RepID=A0A6I3WCR7_9PSED|nr:hypothetical protein [Pseudomonas spelaei]MUF08047.1 hypothetical protein [Pseudomonas spelaei]
MRSVDTLRNIAPQPAAAMLRDMQLEETDSQRASETNALTPRTQADKDLATTYATALRKYANELPSTLPLADVMPGIPPASLFGQWRAHLHNVLQLPALNSWLVANGFDLSQGFSIYPSNARVLQHKADGSATSVFGLEARRANPKEWNLLLAAAKVLAPGRNSIGVHPDINRVTVREVGLFHGNDWTSHPTKAGLEQRALDLENNGGTLNLKLDDPRGEDHLNIQKQALETFIKRTANTPDETQSASLSTPPVNPHLAGNSALAVLFHQKMLSYPNNYPGFQTLENIPKDSLFGQWRAHFKKILDTTDVKDWAAKEGIDLTKTFVVDPRESGGAGGIMYDENGETVLYTFIQNPPQWWRLLMNAAKALGVDRYQMKDGWESIAPLYEVSHFYRHNELGHRGSYETLDTLLSSTKGALTLSPADPRNEATLATAKVALGNIANQRALIKALDSIAALLSPDAKSTHSISSLLTGLTAQRIPIDPDSTYSQRTVNADETASVADFIKANGWPLPIDRQTVIALSERLGSIELTDGTLREVGDSELAQLYANELDEYAESKTPTDLQHVVKNIPRHSALGQWKAHLHSLLNNAEFKSWASLNQVDLSKPIKITDDGELKCYVNGTPKVFGDPASESLPATWPLICAAADRILVSQLSLSDSPEDATLEEIAAFYDEPPGWSEANLAQRVAILGKTKAFPALQNRSSYAASPSRSETALEVAQRRLGVILNEHSLTRQLSTISDTQTELATALNARAELAANDPQHLQATQVDTKLKQALANALKTTMITLVPDSFLSSALASAPKSVSLEQFIHTNGWLQPQNTEELINLVSHLKRHPLTSALHGNFGGALSWPIPLDDKARAGLEASLKLSKDYDPSKGLLGSLGSTLTPPHGSLEITLDNARKWLNQVLDTPGAKALGIALQNEYKGIASPSSANDLVLAALSVDLERPASPTRTTVAGFDLTDSMYWSTPPSVLVKGLTDHLVNSRRITRDMAYAAAVLLLSRKAPALLVKDIPKTVTMGSHTWVTFTTAVARVEAQAPGASAKMTFAQIMAYADLAPITLSAQGTEQAARKSALKDWGVAQGLLTVNAQDEYTDEQLNTVLNAFNNQITELKAASTILHIDMPNRKTMALAELKRVFGDQIPFEEKCINVASPHRDYKGPYSFLDLYMADKLGPPAGSLKPADTVVNGTLGTGSNTSDRLKLNYWVSSNSKVDIGNLLARQRELPNITSKFDQAFSTYRPKLKQHLPTVVKHLISQMPLDDRKRIEFGKLELFKVTDAHKNKGLGISAAPTYTYKPDPDRLIIKTTLDGVSKTFEFDLKEAGFRHRRDLNDVKAGIVSEYEVDTEYMQPLAPSNALRTLLLEQANTDTTPKSYFSDRTAYIAGTAIQDAAVDRLQTQAKGVTTFDTEFNTAKFLHETVMNLIPLRSAIVNFQQGKIGDGLVDLGLDILGLVMTFATGGASIGAKAAAGASRAARALLGARVIGRLTLSALNPLGGIDDLGRLIVRGGQKALSLGGRLASKMGGAIGDLTGSRRLLGSMNNHDLVAASKRFDAAATGTFKVMDEVFEGTAVFFKGKWYPYSLVNKAPYGKPLALFNPNSIAMGGEIKNIKVLDEGLVLFEDLHGGAKRLTLDAHGVLFPGYDSTAILVNGKNLTPNEFLAHLKSCKVKIEDYDEIRLTVCHSANGGTNSFAAEFAKLTKKPVKGYEGTMYVHPNVESMHLDNFPNRAARRDYLDDRFLGATRKVENKYVEIGVMDNGVMKYYPDPRYKPVKFSAEGVVQPSTAKTPRPVTKAEIEQHNKRVASAQRAEQDAINNNTDFGDYEDFT